MDLLPTKWLSEMEEMNDSAALIHQWQHLSSLADGSIETSSFDYKNQLLLSASSCDDNINISKPCYSSHQIISQQQQHLVLEQKKSWKSSSGAAAAEKPSSSSSSTIISFANSDSPRTTTSGDAYFIHENNNYAKPIFVNSDEIIIDHHHQNTNKTTTGSVILHHHQLGNSSSSYAAAEYGHHHQEANNKSRSTSCRTSAQAQDHVLAERKRREKMTQRFVALSALIPGLTKLDKATVLADAVRYIKELKERVNELEVEVKRNNTSEIYDNGRETTVIRVPVERCRLYGNDENADCCWSEDSGGSVQTSVITPEIEVRASTEGDVLVRVYCKNHTGIIKGVLSEIEKHHLSMVSSSAMPFGDNRLHITIVAQMNIIGESKITAKGLAENLRMAILKLLS